MPVTPSAEKALRRDKRKTKINKPVRTKVLSAVKKVIKSPSADSLKEAYSAVDRAAKRGVIHKNKASRIKSRLQKKIKPRFRSRRPPPRNPEANNGSG